MTAQEYLSQAVRLKRQIESDQRKIEYWTEKGYGVSGMQYDAMPHNPNCPSDAPFVRCLEKVFALREDLRVKAERLAAVRMEINTRIGLLGSPEERLVLRRRYLDGCSWTAIAELMILPEREVLHIHGNALQHFSAPGVPD